jgi:hypothetical protein
VPWSEAAAGPLRWAENARQISSFFTKGAPDGVKVPFMVVSGLSHDTWVPGPWGSRATASAALARRQSSSFRSGDRGMAAAGVIVPVLFLDAHHAHSEAARAQRKGDDSGRQRFHGFAQDGI